MVIFPLPYNPLFLSFIGTVYSRLGKETDFVGSSVDFRRTNGLHYFLSGEYNRWVR